MIRGKVLEMYMAKRQHECDLKTQHNRRSGKFRHVADLPNC
jgi:hypothetical protein